MLTHSDDGSSLFTNSELSNQPEKSPTGQYVAKSSSAQLVDTARLSVDHLAPTTTTPRTMQSEAANLTKPIKPIEQTDPLVVTISEEICKAIEPFLNATAKPASLTDIEKLIIKASEKNSPEVLKAHLISNGPLENKNLESLLTALLLFSAKKGYWDCARILIEFGSANVNGADIDSENFMLPLKQAVIQGNAEMVQFLIKNGADMGVERQIKNEINKNDSGLIDSDCEDEDECKMMVDTPLMIALDQGNEEIIRILASFPDKKGRTALMIAIQCVDEEVVRSIINKAGPELLDQLLNFRDIDGNTPLMLAAMCGKIFLPFLQALKAVKKDINRINFNDIKNNIIKTPLMLAIEYGRKEALKLLIEEAKADPALLDKLFAANDNDSIFAWAVRSEWSMEEDMEGLIQALIAADINPNKYFNIKNKDGHTPLMLMVQCGYEEALKLLIKEAKADPALLDKLFTDSDKDGNTIFALAGRKGKKEIMEVLIQALIAADISPNKYLNLQNKDGHTPLMLAAKNGHQNTIKLLLTKAGVDLNIRDHKNKTALTHAALYAANNNKEWESIKILNRYGANISDIHEVLATEIATHVKKIEKNGLTRSAQDLIINGASLKTASKINDIKKWAQIWGIKGNFTIKDEKGRETIFRLAGSSHEFMLQVLINYVSSFYKSNFSQNLISEDEDREIQTSIEKALFKSSSNIDSIDFQEIQSGEGFDPLVLLGGSRGHGVSMVIYHNPTQNRAELMICNRGRGASRDSDKKPVEGYFFVKVKRYSFPSMSCINKEMIKKLIEAYENMEEFNKMIAKMVKPLPDNNFVQKKQKMGNCAWASIKGIIALLLRVATLETPEELSRAVTANKEFTAWTRAEALRELLASNPDPSLVLLFIKKYFNKLFGPNSFSFIWIGILESPKFPPKDKKTAIDMLASALKHEMENSSRPGIKDIGGQLENWLTKLSSQLSEHPEGAH